MIRMTGDDLNAINGLLLSASLAMLLFLLMGLIRPWWVIWFLEKKTRLQVLKIFGSMFMLLMLVRLILAAL